MVLVWSGWIKGEETAEKRGERRRGEERRKMGRTKGEDRVRVVRGKFKKSRRQMKEWKRMARG